MTHKQKECLDFIRAYIKIKGFSPTEPIIRYTMKHSNLNETKLTLKALVTQIKILWTPNGISIFKEISRGPDGILKYAPWPKAAT